VERERERSTAVKHHRRAAGHAAVGQEDLRGRREREREREREKHSG